MTLECATFFRVESQFRERLFKSGAWIGAKCVLSPLMTAHTVYLCLGGNLGDRGANLEEAILFITFNIGDITAASSVYESTAWGMENAPAFLNQVLKISTELSPSDLITEIAELEEFFGRERSPSKYLDREMDVDVLFYDDEVMDEEKIQIPHPRLQLRRFVLVPLAEIAPAMVHPVLKRNMLELLNDCEDKSEPVKK